jgi:excisionase family DNA binding protein
MENLLTARQAQELLNVDRTTIYRMLKDGRLTGIKIGKHWRFSSREVNDILAGTPSVAGKTTPVFENVLPLHCIQPIQDVFAEIAEVGTITTDKEGTQLTRISNSRDFCKLILGSDSGRAACARSWKALAGQENTTPEFTTCHAGLQYASAHIELNGEFIAALIAGQFYAEAPNPEEEAQRIHQLAETYQIDETLLSLAAKKISVMEPRKVAQIGKWLEQVAGTFEQISAERADLMGRLRQIAVMSVFDNPSI